MKRAFKYILAISALLLMLTSCNSNSGITDVDLWSENPTECTIANFNYNDFYIVRTYKNGKVDKIPLTEKMISEYERLKFYQPGKQEVEVVYMGAKLYLNIKVNRNRFSVKLNPDNIVYDGLPHELSFDGYLPNNVTVTYPFGKSFADVGSHMVRAIISCPSFETETVEAFLTITPATIDMSNVGFKDQNYVYDGEEKEIIEISDLPENVEVDYYVNGTKDGKMVNSGEYLITAKFRIKEGSKNYNQIEDKTAKYVIEKGVYDISDLELKDPEVYYTGEEYEWVLKNELPEWIYVTYKNNKQTEIGIYDDIYVTLESNNPNYWFKIGDNDYSKEITLKLEAAIIPV